MIEEAVRLKKDWLAQGFPEAKNSFSSVTTEEKTWMYEVSRGAITKAFCLASSSNKQSGNSRRGNRAWLFTHGDW